MVVHDLDKPVVIVSFWGEVTSNAFGVLGRIGTITDGAIRTLDEMTCPGFKAIARCLCVCHAYVVPVLWDCEVEVIGTRILPGQLIHVDKHGFLAITSGEVFSLLDAAPFMDANEINHVISAARETAGKSMTEILEDLDRAGKAFNQAVKEMFGKMGDWD